MLLNFTHWAFNSDCQVISSFSGTRSTQPGQHVTVQMLLREWLIKLCAEIILSAATRKVGMNPAIKYNRLIFSYFGVACRQIRKDTRLIQSPSNFFLNWPYFSMGSSRNRSIWRARLPKTTMTKKPESEPEKRSMNHFIFLLQSDCTALKPSSSLLLLLLPTFQHTQSWQTVDYGSDTVAVDVQSHSSPWRCPVWLWCAARETFLTLILRWPENREHHNHPSMM